jgi:hypothetical protein
MKTIKTGITPNTKIEYELVQNGSRGYLVKLYMPRFPKNAPFTFFGSLEKCSAFINER